MVGHVWDIRVYYEDTDSGGVVYHSSYLNFMERSRTEWLRGLGINQKKLKQDQEILFVVHHIDIKFKQPAFFDDLLKIQTELIRMGSAKIVVEQKINRGNDCLIEAMVTIACVNGKKLKPKRIPDNIKLIME
jgi:acyl-CoA thioester hydrolase